MARATRKQSAANTAAATAISTTEVPVYDAAAEAPMLPSPLVPPAPLDATALIDAAIEAGRDTGTTAAAVPEALAAVPDAVVQATSDAIGEATAALTALPDAHGAPISDAAAEIVAATMEPVVAAGAAVSPAQAANTFADGVTALCESGAALAEGFGRLNAHLTDIAYGNLREGLALQQAFFGLGGSDSIAKRGPAWVGERIGSLASVPGEIAMIAFETAEAAAKPVVRQARARLAAGGMGDRLM